MGDYEDGDLASSAPAQDYSVCARCFNDGYIQEFIESTVDSPNCDFCGRKSRVKNIAAPLDGVVDFILEAVDREYDRAVNALGWESAEGGYLGEHWDSYDLIEQIGLDLPNDPEVTRRALAALGWPIGESDGGFGRYHFRLSWDIVATSEMRPAPDSRRDGDERRSGGGFVWNNVLNFHGEGRGSAVYNDSDMRRLMGVNVDIDRGGRIQVAFRTDRGRPVLFTGSVVARDEGRLKADVASEDGRLRGPMFLTVDDRQNVSSVKLEATDGRDRVRVNWDRR